MQIYAAENFPAEIRAILYKGVNNMKKILAFLMAVTACFCTFTSCGDTDESESKESGSNASDEKEPGNKVSDKDEDDSDEKDKDKKDKEDEDELNGSDSDKKDPSDDIGKTTEVDKFEIEGEKPDETDPDSDITGIGSSDMDDPGNKPSGNSGETSDDVYLKIFNDFCSLGMSKDTAGLLNLTFPDKLTDAMKKINALDAMAEEIDGSYDALEDIDISEVKVSKVEDCDAVTKSNLEKLYSVYSNLFLCMAENNIMYDDMESGNIDESKAMLLLEPAMQLSQLDDVENMDVDISIPFEEAKVVTFSAGGEEQEFVMYRISGEDWKMDTIGLAFFGF